MNTHRYAVPVPMPAYFRNNNNNISKTTVRNFRCHLHNSIYYIYFV